jgi:hypothetical protein
VYTDSHFAFNVVDSKFFTLRDIVIDGNFPIDVKSGSRRGNRIMAFCPLANYLANGLTVQNVVSRGFNTFGYILGNAYGVLKLDSFTPDTAELSPQSRFRDYILNHYPPQFSVPACTGKIRDVNFSGNNLTLNDTSFYLVPFSGHSAVTGSRPLSLINWLSISKSLFENTEGDRYINTNFTIEGNLFRITQDARQNEWADEAHTYYLRPSNVMKLHHASQLTISNNRFIVRNPTESSSDQALTMGAAINVAPGMGNVTILGNKFDFGLVGNPKNEGRAIVIHSGFIPHKDYGIGVEQAMEPSLSVRIQNNSFLNSRVLLTDFCSLSFGDYCADLDSHQNKDDEKYQSLVVKGNDQNHAKAIPESLLVRYSVIQSENWVNPPVCTSSPCSERKILRSNVWVDFGGSEAVKLKNRSE